MVATRVAAAENFVAAPQLVVHHQDEIFRESDLLPLASAAMPPLEMAGGFASASPRFRMDSEEAVSFGAGSTPPPVRQTRPSPQPVVAAAAAARPAAPAPVRPGRNPEAEKKTKWMDLPAIWRRARRPSKSDEKAAEA